MVLFINPNRFGFFFCFRSGMRGHWEWQPRKLQRLGEQLREPPLYHICVVQEHLRDVRMRNLHVPWWHGNHL